MNSPCSVVNLKFQTGKYKSEIITVHHSIVDWLLRSSARQSCSLGATNQLRRLCSSETVIHRYRCCKYVIVEGWKMAIAYTGCDHRLTLENGKSNDCDPWLLLPIKTIECESRHSNITKTIDRFVFFSHISFCLCNKVLHLVFLLGPFFFKCFLLYLLWFLFIYCVLPKKEQATMEI